ncbi:hypothetical protein Tco_0923091 [Tanacetum coccineum]|uniref:Uncharacterized protein n=1 Tax=Tanacetum coccineum TaxID=301880 RepID=A0ABQ5D2U6_9ASTR
MEFNRWRSKNFKNEHPVLVKIKDEMDDEGEVTNAGLTMTLSSAGFLSFSVIPSPDCSFRRICFPSSCRHSKIAAVRGTKVAIPLGGASKKGLQPNLYLETPTREVGLKTPYLICDCCEGSHEADEYKQNNLAEQVYLSEGDIYNDPSILRFYHNDDTLPWGNNKRKEKGEDGPEWVVRSKFKDELANFMLEKKSHTPSPHPPPSCWTISKVCHQSSFSIRKPGLHSVYKTVIDSMGARCSSSSSSSSSFSTSSSSLSSSDDSLS